MYEQAGSGNGFSLNSDMPTVVRRTPRVKMATYPPSGRLPKSLEAFDCCSVEVVSESSGQKNGIEWSKPMIVCRPFTARQERAEILPRLKFWGGPAPPKPSRGQVALWLCGDKTGHVRGSSFERNSGNRNRRDGVREPLHYV
ncbi:hypothetical protein V492_00363 [Pseudogymnoascus sp. VKM F-4246]|nr:hypothetical protein V492_00363 [Pseudogymnoascus sp. VKM F-4246]